MTGKRKRNCPGHKNEGGNKRQRVSGSFNGKEPVVKNALLSHYYPQVFSLREYLISKLPTTSKIRRKKILSVGKKPEGEKDQNLAEFLNQTLVGVLSCKDVSPEERLQQWTSFSQRIDSSDSNIENLSEIGQFSQAEIIDFTIWLLFSKARNGRVQHLLCQGFKKDFSIHRAAIVTSAIPGLVSTYPNSHVTSMKAEPWPRILALMGKEGEKTMIDLILDCGIFLPIENTRGSYQQLCGQPFGDLKPLSETSARTLLPTKVKTNHPNPTPSRAIRTPAIIAFVRNRMLYARAALNAQASVRFGFRHIHVLNRYPWTPQDDSQEGGSSSTPAIQQNTTHVMMYIFPRQFGLHNVFTHDVNPQETVQPFKDYTLREEEIHQKFPTPSTVKIPKRLRGKVVSLVQKLQKQHSRCPYKKLLDYYCPISDAKHRSQTSSIEESQEMKGTNSTAFKSQDSLKNNTVISRASAQILPGKRSLMDHATPTAMVSAFCRAVLSYLIPHDFWGSGESRGHNERVFYQNIDCFIKLRQFENLSLHEVSQGIKIAHLEWLGPPALSNQKLSLSDLNKRVEIFHEFIYYLFDSILIPLIRANFHVTESNINRYRLFFFRHDIWRSLAEPAIASLKANMFEEIKLGDAQNILDSRSLGFSQVRLLPKETGVRPIINLRRRALKKGSKVQLGSSINTILTPIYNVLSFEKTSNPDRLGSALFSIGDLYRRLKSFKSTLQDPFKPLYFAKVDVKAAFDTIPQQAILKLMSSLPTSYEYRIAKHFEIKPGDGHHDGVTQSKPMRKWSALAKSPNDFRTFNENLTTDLAVGRKNTIFVETIVNQFRDTDELLKLLSEHVCNNIVKIGKKFYRQKEGIPQGSVLSSLLCNYFYADLESAHLSFLQSGDSLLLRLIDDFLLITTNRGHAKQFLQIMHDGLPAYGVRVNPDKTLVNFEVTVNEKRVMRLVGTRNFPYCGSFVDTKTLDMRKDRERRKDMAIADSLTVEFSRMPGKTFHRKILNTFKIQAHAMFLDTSHNSLSTVLSNINGAFVETATKMHAYNRCLPVGKQPAPHLIIKTIQDLIELAFVLMKSKGKNKTNVGYKCGVKKIQVQWLAINAFKQVLLERLSKYRAVLAFLDSQIMSLHTKSQPLCDKMEGVLAATATNSFD